MYLIWLDKVYVWTSICKVWQVCAMNHEESEGTEEQCLFCSTEIKMIVKIKTLQKGKYEGAI